MKHLCKGILFLAVTAALSIPLSAKPLQVVTTSTDLAAIVRQIGGNQVSVESLTAGSQDQHRVLARPSMVIKVRQADLLVRLGMDLDDWVESLIQTSRNDRIFIGNTGYLDASKDVVKLNVPTGKVDASMGDIHIYGNPHYWLDPANGIIVARTIKEKLSRLKPEAAGDFENRYQRFKETLEAKLVNWRSRMAPYKQSGIITYHDTWPYFARQFELKIINTVEPKPGIPPSPSHILALRRQLKEENIKAIIVEPYYDVNVARRLGQDTNTPVLVVPTSLSERSSGARYEDLFEEIVTLFEKTIR